MLILTFLFVVAPAGPPPHVGPALNVPIPGATFLATAISGGAAFNINHANFSLG